MRTTLLALTSMFIAACATTPADDDVTAGGGGGGKADDATTSCPVSGGVDKIVAAIEKGGNCATAAGIAEACAYGSSADLELVDAATTVCSRGFGAMPAAVKADYDGLLGRCADKYADESGTMYLAITAFCQLDVTSLYNTLYPEPTTSQPAVPLSPECPIADANPDKVEAAIKRAHSCGQAADIAKACAWGSTIDLQFVEAAAPVCSGSVSLSAADKALHDKLVDACTTKYEDLGGTLALSVTAFCGLDIDVVFANLYR